ncbi:MAG: hypothetical protein VX589_10825 [Myxococcota bacterium]|nr:hypothetical protein [Myxococcota bacterium]
MSMLVLVGLAATAHGRGPGIRNGDVVFHPRFVVAGGYDSNFFRDSANDATSPVNPVTLLRLGGGLNVTNRNPNRAMVKLDLESRFRYVTASNADETASPLDEDFALDTVRSKLHLSLLPKNPVTFDLRGRMRYTERPAIETVATDGFNRLSYELGPDVLFRPGGRALEFRVGYRYGADLNLTEDPSLGARRGDKDTHKLGLVSHWKFFPKTALLLDVSYWFVNYRQSNDASQADVGQTIESPVMDARPFRAELGVKGLITQRFALTLRGGYSLSSNQQGASYAGPIGRVDVDYRFEPRVELGTGYRLKLGNDGFSNYYVLHRGFAKATVNLPGHVALTGRGGFDYYDYATDGAPEWTKTLPNGGKRTEPIIRAEAGVSWNMTQWLKLSIDWEFENNRSGFYYCLGNDPGSVCTAGSEDRTAYIRHVVMLGLYGEY